MNSDYQHMSYEELIPRVLKNDKAATNALAERSYESVYYHCLKLVKNPDDAQDLTQDTFLKILKQLPSLKDHKAFPKWSNLIAVNTCQDHLRKNQRSKVVTFAPGENDDEDGIGDPYETLADQDHQVSPEKKLDNDETRNMMNELIDALPEDQRSSVLMYYYDNFSVKEISEAAHVSENTIKSRLSYSRAKIKTGVEEYQKKFGIKLYNVAPVTFLTYISYFLHKDSSDKFLLLKAALPTAVLLKGATVATASAGAKGILAAGAAKGAAAGAGTFFHGVLGTVTGKIAAAVAAVLLIGGGTFGVTQILNNSAAMKDQEIAVSSVIETSSTAGGFDRNSAPGDLEPIIEAEESSEKSEKESSDSSVVQSESSTEVQESSADSESSVSLESSEESSEEAACSHQLYRAFYYPVTCSESEHTDYVCYVCGARWTEVIQPALGGTCNNPASPWFHAGEIYTEEYVYDPGSDSFYCQNALYGRSTRGSCTKCGNVMSTMNFEASLNGYSAGGISFTSEAEAENYARDNSLYSYSIQYLITSADTNVTVVTFEHEVKTDAEHRPPTYMSSDWSR